jgi:ubiquinone/menaquinone biosynthesis C-methylase UbiE
MPPAYCALISLMQNHEKCFHALHPFYDLQQTIMNLWRNSLVALAYSYQQNARPYAELLETTESFIFPKIGQRWLDLGCGSGRLIQSIWQRSNGEVGIIVGMDVSFTALKIAKRVSSHLVPTNASRRISLVQADLSQGLQGVFRPLSFDGITAGLSISYADHWDSEGGKWDDQSYVRLLQDIYHLLKDGGTFIFSTNVPNPDFVLIAKRSWREIFLTWRLPLGILVSFVMLLQSRWLKHSAQTGRFHYLPVEQITQILCSTGFKDIRRRLTYAGQAWVFLAIK